MKNAFLLLFLFYFLTGCNKQHVPRKEKVAAYYTAFDSGNYNTIKTIAHDTLTLISGDYTTPYTPESFYEFFKWDSVFKPSYEIIALETKNENVIATVSQDNIRNAFLKNNPLKFKVQVSFAADKISKLEELDYIDVNWNVWNQEKEALVRWIKNNHPDLDGFVEDMTLTGAKDYIKAIELYTQSRDSLP